MAQHSTEITPFACRFETPKDDPDSYRDFCAFEFPGCAGCPKTSYVNAVFASKEDPLKAWNALAPAYVALKRSTPSGL